MIIAQIAYSVNFHLIKFYFGGNFTNFHLISSKSSFSHKLIKVGEMNVEMKKLYMFKDKSHEHPRFILSFLLNQRSNIRVYFHPRKEPFD